MTGNLQTLANNATIHATIHAAIHAAIHAGLRLAIARCAAVWR